jgi:hypothetical protein
MSLTLTDPTLTATGTSYAHTAAMRGLVSSAWHGLWHAASTSPWIAIAVMVPAVAVLIGCTRVTVRRG